MHEIAHVEAFYPAFEIGNRPHSIPCRLSIVEAQGKRYLKTPFAFMDAFNDDDHLRQIGRGYYATEAECDAYLAQEYPMWERAQPIMLAWLNNRTYYGTIVGDGRTADAIGCGLDQLGRIARGHKSLGKVSHYVKRLAASKVGS